jgi:hypothetical protein|tara:strand:+ start:380 stop:487 length:108 start_codon:yes stop_codon:yes gene_type:complete
MRARFLDWGFFIEAGDFIPKKYQGKRIRKLKRIAA